MKNVEDIYPLTAMQELMFFHSLSTRQGDVLFNQFSYRLNGELNISAFQLAWQHLLDRHAVLRTAFISEELKQPLQVVRKKLALPFQYFDWQTLSPDQQREKLNTYRKEDRQQGFDIRKAPLTRITLIQCKADCYYLIWSSHHLLLDRWCLSTIFEELYIFYQAECLGQTASLSPPGSYRGYIQWIQAQNQVDAELFWRETLQDFVRPTSISRIIPGIEPGLAIKAELTLSKSMTTSITKAARVQGVTVSTVIQAAWALLLNRHTHKTDVVFGVAVSGRPAELDGVESIIGSFINNLPVRIHLPPRQTFAGWLKTLQTAQQKRLKYEYLSLMDIQSWSQLSSNEALFDTLLVWLTPDEVKIPENLCMTALDSDLNTTYPLTVGISVSAESIYLQASLDCRYEPSVPLNKLLERFAEILQLFTTVPDDYFLSDLEGYQSNVDLSDTPRSGVKSEPTSVQLDEKGADSSLQTTGRENADKDILEDLLYAGWQQLLAVSDIKPDDNFFDLGGTSLLAVQLHILIKASTRKEIPLLVMFKYPTIRQMVKTLHEENWSILAQTMFPLRSYGALPPLFCIASPEVNTLGYALLSRHLNDEQPVYILQQPPLADNVIRVPPSIIPEVAELYIKEMRKIQDNGPYQLLGMCSGAQISVEMARLLAKENEKVDFLGIINTWGFYTVSRVYYVTRIFNRISYYYARIQRLFYDERDESFAIIYRIMQRRINTFKSVMQINKKYEKKSANAKNFKSGFQVQNVPSQSNTNTRDAWIEDVGWSWRDPKVQKYSGTATVFRIKKQQNWRISSPVLGWDKQVEKISVVHLPGNEHEALLREPHVRILAEKIQEQLKSCTH